MNSFQGKIFVFVVMRGLCIIILTIMNLSRIKMGVIIVTVKNLKGEMMLCNQCQDVGFIVKGGVKVSCVCSKFRRLAAYAPQLVKSVIQSDKGTREDFATTYEDDRRVYLRLRKGLNEVAVDTAIIFWLLKHNQPAFKVMNVYELIEIFLQHHPVYKSMFDLKFPALVLLQGYDEFPNVRQNDAILQVLEIMRRHDGLVLYISTRQDISPEIANYLKLHNWKIIDKQRGEGKDSYGRI